MSWHSKDNEQKDKTDWWSTEIRKAIQAEKKI